MKSPLIRNGNLNRFQKFRLALKLLWVRDRLGAGRFDEALECAAACIEKFPDNAMAMVAFADVLLFLEAAGKAREAYRKARKLNNAVLGPDRQFLGAYAGYRLLEIEFLMGEHDQIAKPQLIDGINTLPAGRSCKTLFRLDPDADFLPRPHLSKKEMRRREAVART